MKQKLKTYRYLKQVVKRIGEKFHPKKIILFGSYANGTPTRDSDVDLLVILPSKEYSKRKYAEISRELEPMMLPVDLLIRSTKDISYRLKIGDSFIEEITDKGKILYES